MSDLEKFNSVLADTFLIEDDECQDANGPDQISTWDSLATLRISSEMAEQFSVEISPEEMTSWLCIGDIKTTLKEKGVKFD